MTLKIPYVYDYITKLCRKQAEVIQNHLNPNVQGGARNHPACGLLIKSLFQHPTA
jgi:hypothetical protein